MTVVDDTSDLPPLATLTSTEKEELKTSAESIISSTTTLTPISGPFKPTRSLFINSRGIRSFRLPLPSSELEIPIYGADGELLYTSVRERRSSGNAVLSHIGNGQLIATEYFFGPGRDPKLHLLQRGLGTEQTITVSGKWTSRAQTFKTPGGLIFEWSYKREAATTEDAKKKTFLVMEIKNIDGDPKAERRVAQLVRNKETRAPGSNKCSAGNGGELVIDGEAALMIGEEVVVATCLMMLKKEIDRRRMVQMMVIAGAASGGS